MLHRLKGGIRRRACKIRHASVERLTVGVKQRRALKADDEHGLLFVAPFFDAIYGRARSPLRAVARNRRVIRVPSTARTE